MKNLTDILNPRNFLVLLSLVVFTSCNITKQYTEEAKKWEQYTEGAKKWEKNIQKFEQLDKEEQYPKDAIIFTGSSSITLWSTIKDDMAPYPVIHRGFGGSRFSDLAVYIDRIVHPHDMQALVIFEANDITGTKWDRTPEEVAQLFKHIVKVVRKKHHKKPIFVIEITPTESRWPTWSKIKEANQLLEKTAKGLKNVYFIPTASHFLNEKSEPKKELFRDDKLHLNRQGYDLWKGLIKSKLDEVLIKK